MSLNRRDLLKYLAITPGLSLVPCSKNLYGQDRPSTTKNKIRGVIRVQMCAGMDVALGMDPPIKELHMNQDQWMVHTNLPSGVNINRSGFNFGNGNSADANSSRLIYKRVTDLIGKDFYNNSDNSGLRQLANSDPSKVFSFNGSNNEFIPISGDMGGTFSGNQNLVPFRQLTSDENWSKIFSNNPNIALGPLMHQFMEKIDPNGKDKIEESYLNYMTIINGIDTNLNVAHRAGDVLAATGFMASVGNSSIANLRFKPSFEAIIANELMGNSNLMPHNNVGAGFFPVLTFTNPSQSRGYSRSNEMTPLAQFFDVTSLDDLNKKIVFNSNNLNSSALNEILNRLKSISQDKKQLALQYNTLKDFISNGGLSLEYEAQEKEAFSNMLDIFYDGNILNTGDNQIPNVLYRSNAGTGQVLLNNINNLRQNLSANTNGSYQNNLATAALMIRKGMARGVNVNFGGFTGLIPDTHRHNDYIQTHYQGTFWNGIRRLINYLRWNKDEETGAPLIDSTLVVVSADIIRGPTYFDQGVQGRSDYRNNSMLLIGGGLNHTTSVQSGTKLPGRLIGYSHGSYDSARIDLNEGDDLPFEKSTNKAIDNKITFSNIYASLTDMFGIDYKKYYPDAKLIQTISNNSSGKPKTWGKS